MLPETFRELLVGLHVLTQVYFITTSGRVRADLYLISFSCFIGAMIYFAMRSEQDLKRLLKIQATAMGIINIKLGISPVWMIEPTTTHVARIEAKSSDSSLLSCSRPTDDEKGFSDSTLSNSAPVAAATALRKDRFAVNVFDSSYESSRIIDMSKQRTDSATATTRKEATNSVCKQGDRNDILLPTSTDDVMSSVIITATATFLRKCFLNLSYPTMTLAFGGVVDIFTSIAMGNLVEVFDMTFGILNLVFALLAANAAQSSEQASRILRNAVRVNVIIQANRFILSENGIELAGRTAIVRFFFSLPNMDILDEVFVHFLPLTAVFGIKFGLKSARDRVPAVLLPLFLFLVGVVPYYTFKMRNALHTLIKIQEKRIERRLNIALLSIMGMIVMITFVMTTTSVNYTTLKTSTAVNPRHEEFRPIRNFFARTGPMFMGVIVWWYAQIIDRNVHPCFGVVQRFSSNSLKSVRMPMLCVAPGSLSTADTTPKNLANQTTCVECFAIAMHFALALHYFMHQRFANKSVDIDRVELSLLDFLVVLSRVTVAFESRACSRLLLELSTLAFVHSWFSPIAAIVWLNVILFWTATACVACQLSRENWDRFALSWSESQIFFDHALKQKLSALNVALGDALAFPQLDALGTKSILESAYRDTTLFHDLCHMTSVVTKFSLGTIKITRISYTLRECIVKPWVEEWGLDGGVLEIDPLVLQDEYISCNLDLLHCVLRYLLFGSKPTRKVRICKSALGNIEICIAKGVPVEHGASSSSPSSSSKWQMDGQRVFVADGICNIAIQQGLNAVLEYRRSELALCFPRVNFPRCKLSPMDLATNSHSASVPTKPVFSLRAIDAMPTLPLVCAALDDNAVVRRFIESTFKSQLLVDGYFVRGACFEQAIKFPREIVRKNVNVAIFDRHLDFEDGKAIDGLQLLREARLLGFHGLAILHTCDLPTHETLSEFDGYILKSASRGTFARAIQTIWTEKGGVSAGV